MNRDRLERKLQTRFGGDDDVLRIVSRQARDLADSTKFEADSAHSLTPDVVVTNLADAPDDHTLVDRWNWWMESLELSYGGYQRFRVRLGVRDK